MHYEIDLLQQIDRPGADLLYFRASYWPTEADRIAGAEPVVRNDFVSGDLLRWPGQPRIVKPRRINTSTGNPEILCGTHDLPRGHWVAFADLFDDIDIGGGVIRRVRVHHPKRVAAGNYTVADVREWIEEQAEDWINRFPNRRGDRTNPELAIERPAQAAKLPGLIRNMPRRRTHALNPGHSRRNARIAVEKLRAVPASQLPVDDGNGGQMTA